MAFFRRWFLSLSALLLSGGLLVAAPSREDRAFSAAAAAFQDAVWNRAETEFAQFIQKYPKSTNAPLAVLLQAQAQMKQGKFTEALTQLAAAEPGAGNLADQYEYWRAQAQFQSGDFPAAAGTFEALAQNYPVSPLRLPAVVEAAAAHLQLGDWAQVNRLLAETNSMFQRAAQLDADNELVARGHLLLAQAEFTQKHFAAAAAILDRVNPAPLAPALNWQRLYLLAEVELGAGDWDAAWATATNLTRLPKSVALAVESAALRGLILEKAGRWPEARAAWSENLATNLPVARQREAVLKIAALATAEKNPPVAEAALRNFLAQFGDDAGAGLVRLTLGELYLQDFVAQPASNQLVAAQAQFDQVTNSPLAGKAFLDRGWTFWLATNFAASRVEFQLAAAQLPRSEDQAVAIYKAGDALFLEKNFASARECYSNVLTQFAGFPAVAKSLGDRALYQRLRASLELKDQPDAERAMEQLLALFPHSELADQSLLLAGEGASDFGSPTNARSIFQRFVALYPDSRLRPQVALAVARTFERQSDWPAAIAAYEQWRGDYATNALRPQVDFALAQANFQAGHEAVAFGQFTNFVAQYAADPSAPLAQWWVADHFFRAGEFVPAEKNYQLLELNWPTNELIYSARLMAGRAAMGRQSFRDAADYFLKLTTITNCPADIFTKAMFAYGSVLTRMDSPDTNRPFLNFETATNVFAQLCAANPTNETGALAWSELGDCAQQLGAWDVATNAYAQVIASPYARPGLRSRAQVGLGLTWEKQAALCPVSEQKPLFKLALESYRDALYGTDDAAADLWTKKAGLSALPLMLKLGEDDREKLDKFFRRLEQKLPQLTEQLEKKRAALNN